MRRSWRLRSGNTSGASGSDRNVEDIANSFIYTARTARFVMNSQLVTAGYPWVVVPVERRDEYMASLEKASVEEDIEPFVKFIVSLIGK